MIDLTAKVAIVTGGCSGIGRGTVEVLRRAGARVACVDVQDDKGHALARELGDGVLYVHADVTSEDEVAAAFARVTERFGGIDVLFNNAGAAEPLASDPFDLAIFERVQKLLVHSIVLGMKYAAPSMTARGGGSIVNTASVAGLQAGYGPFAYSVAKGAVVHLSRVAAAFLARDAIRVNAICPGLIPTSIFGRALGESIADADRRARDISERAHGFQPIRIAGSPEDIGNAVAYFASDLSRFVTGQFLAVDGGLTVGPRAAWEESAAVESWARLGISEEQVKGLLGGRAMSRDLDLHGLTIARAMQALRARELSPLELTEAYLDRIARLDPQVNAYTTVTAERARADARRATEELAAGRARGPLHGIPVALKDLYETAGIRTTAGAKIHADHVPAADCTVARRLRDAGTIFLGKLATHEYAYGCTTSNPHFGATHNPWNLAHIPGGSSGGSGAAIAAGLATATTGTDTGGSIRIPASICGVVGLKPTYGRVSKAGVFPLSYLFDHAGPITRTVEDAALVLNAIAGYDPADPASVRIPVEDWTAALGGDLRGLRIGVPRPHFFAQLDDEVAAAVERALGDLRALGAEVRDVEIDGIGDAVGAVFGLVLAEAQEIHADALRTRPGDFGPDVRDILQSPGPDTLAVMRALRTRDALSAAMRATLESVDLLVTPTTPVVATRIGEETVRYGEGEDSIIMAMIRCTAPFNATGLPALSLPCGFTRAGLPVGLQLVGRPFDEATVLRAGHAYEQATEWHERKAPLAGGR